MADQMSEGVDVAFLQDLSTLFGRELGHTCNFIGDGGMIVASSASERIGNHHAIGARILAGEIDEREVTQAEAKRSKGMREGYNQAVEIDGARILTVGVAGPIAEVKPLCHILRYCAEAFIKARLAETARAREAAVADHLSHLADDLQVEIRKALDQVAEDTENLMSVAHDVEAAADRVNDAVDAALSSAKQTAGIVETMAAAGEELSASIDEILRQLNLATGMTGEAVGCGHHTDEVVAQLSDQARKIGDVVTVISTIARQTNLLALNATIEAARAGQAGKGFAVVASEVKTLSNQTGGATSQVATQVRSIQDVISDVNEATHQILGSVDKLSDITQTIKEAVEQQTTATHEISENVGSVVDGTDAVAKNIAMMTEEVQRSREMAKLVSATSGRVRTTVGGMGETLLGLIERARDGKAGGGDGRDLMS